MKIGNKWKIESDSLNIILYRKKKRVKKDTKEVYEDWETMGYFSTIPNALREMINQRIRDTELKDVKTIIAEIDKLETLLQGLSQPPQAISDRASIN